MKCILFTALALVAYQVAPAAGQLVACGPASCSGGWECCNESCGYCVPPGETCNTNEVCTQCGPNVCSGDQECCNDSCGTCIAQGQGGTCSQTPCAQCGPNTCGPGLECCNESCGTCTEPGGGCTQEFCGSECGPSTCNEGEECCNESCGTCAPVGGGVCTMEFCGTPCGEYECPLGTECCNESCGTCVEPGGMCTMEFCGPTCPEAGGGPCTADEKPVQCGVEECDYPNLCTAESAGFMATDCCPVAQGPCTSENDPVKCEHCDYGSQSCADAAGYTSEQCCKQPKDLGACPAVIDPVTCSQVGCVYDNGCIAELAGFDPKSCVKGGNPTPTVLNNAGSAACSMSNGPFGNLAAMFV